MAFLELSQIVFSYPGRESAVLNGVNLAWEREGISAIIGPNGSGKTTLTKIMLGILRPSSGEARLEGRPVQEYSLAQIGRRIGYVFQNPEQQLFAASVAEEIGFGPACRGEDSEVIRERVEFLLDYFELSPYRRVFPLHLSCGEKRRLAIAAVLANEPDFLILDEPTVGLDAYRKELLAEHLFKVARLGRGMVLVSHDTAFIKRMAARVITLEKGRVQWDRDGGGNGGHES